MHLSFPPARHLALAVAIGLVFNSAAQAARFSSIDTFGDSLSDTGHFEGFPGLQPRFTTNPDRVWVEHLAENLGLTSGVSATHHSAGGARTTEQDGYPNPLLAPLIPPVASQIDAHLARNQRLDRAGLYAVWSGANDVISAVEENQALLLDPSTQMAGALQIVGDVKAAARDVAALTKRLQDAGAGTVLVMNLPDLGQTPAASAMQAQEIMGLASQQFNAALRDGLADVRGNVVMLDAYAMMNEIIEAPARFGLDNVTEPACTNESSQRCTRATLVDEDAHRRYLFADSLHPTGAGHRMLSDYAVSVLEAPAQMGLLADAPKAGLALSSRHTADRLRTLSEPGLYVHVDHDSVRAQQTDRYAPGVRNGVNAVTVGVDRRVGERVLLGASITHAQHRSTVTGDRGRFDLAQTLLSAYGQYRVGPWAGSLAATAGVLDYGRVTRNFSIGTARLTERGSTDGTQFGLTAATRYDWTLGPLTVSPIASLSVHRTNVNAFTEKRDERRATSMRYLRQRQDSVVSSIGLDLAGTWQMGGLTLTPFARAAYEHEHHAANRKVRAHVQGMAGSFASPTRAVTRHTGVATLGLQGQVSRSIQVNFAYNARLSSREQSHWVQAGLNVVF